MYEEKHKDAQKSREAESARQQQLVHSVHVLLGLVALMILLAAAMYFLPSETQVVCAHAQVHPRTCTHHSPPVSLSLSSLSSSTAGGCWPAASTLLQEK